MSSGEGPSNGLLALVVCMRAFKAASVRCGSAGGLVESVMANAVGDARISGNCSLGSSSSGVGSRGGGVVSRLGRTGYFRCSSLCVTGGVFSFELFGLLNRSRELRVPLEVVEAVGVLEAAAAAFFRRSSASFASFEDPPSSLRRAGAGNAGTRSPCSVEGTEDHGTSLNQSANSVEEGDLSSVHHVLVKVAIEMRPCITHHLNLTHLKVLAT